MGGAQHPHLVGQQLLEQAQRPPRIPALPGPARDIAAGAKGGAVIGPLEALVQGEFLFAMGQGLRVVPNGAVVGGEGGMQVW